MFRLRFHSSPGSKILKIHKCLIISIRKTLLLVGFCSKHMSVKKRNPYIQILQNKTESYQMSFHNETFEDQFGPWISVWVFGNVCFLCSLSFREIILAVKKWIEKEDIRDQVADYLIILHLKNWKPDLGLKSKNDIQGNIYSKALRM